MGTLQTTTKGIRIQMGSTGTIFLPGYEHYENITPRPGGTDKKLIDKPIQAGGRICKHANLPSLKLRVPIPRTWKRLKMSIVWIDIFDHRMNIHHTDSICIHRADCNNNQ